MYPLTETAARGLEPATAAEVLRAVELYSAWENLQAARPTGPLADAGLRAFQRAYEAFDGQRARVAQRLPGVRLPEPRHHSSKALAAWVRVVLGLVERSPAAAPPAATAAFALGMTDRLAGRLGVERAARSGDAAAELAEVARWCEALPSPVRRSA